MKDPINLRDVRSISEQPTLTADGQKIVGYAAVFNSFSQDLGGFKEIIRPGAFDRSLASGADVRALVDHDSSKIIGRTKSGTAKLTVDQRGLRYEITPPDTTAANDLMKSMKRGDVDGSSFAFTAAQGGDKWRKEGGQTIRELHDVDLYDVSVVTYPAYTASEASLRSLNAVKDAPPAEPESPAAVPCNRRLRQQLVEKEIA